MTFQIAAVATDGFVGVGDTLITHFDQVAWTENKTKTLITTDGQLAVMVSGESHADLAAQKIVQRQNEDSSWRPSHAELINIADRAWKQRFGSVPVELSHELQRGCSLLIFCARLGNVGQLWVGQRSRYENIDPIGYRPNGNSKTTALYFLERYVARKAHSHIAQLLVPLSFAVLACGELGSHISGLEALIWRKGTAQIEILPQRSIDALRARFIKFDAVAKQLLAEQFPD
jgi:hypothetical protein